MKLIKSDKERDLMYDAVTLIKNIRNNLLHHERLMFPPFSSNSLGGKPVEVKGGEIPWSLLHKVREKDMDCQANLRAAPKLQANAVHPGNCKQNNRVALAIFDPSTIAL